MSTKERIEKIEIECRNLLAIAEKRTQGRWQAHDGWETDYEREKTKAEHPDWCEIKGAKASLSGHIGYDNGVFIAACAGPAEAGWRVTLGRIEFVKKLRAYDAELNPMIHSLADEEEAAIVADWEQFDR